MVKFGLQSPHSRKKLTRSYMYFRQVQNLLRKLTLIPIFFTALVLGVTLATFYFYETSKTAKDQAQNLASISAELSSPYIDRRLADRLQHALAAIIQHEQVRSIRILDIDKNIITHIGPRYLEKFPTEEWLTRSVNSAPIQSSILRISHPIFSRNQGEIIGWTDIAFDTSASRYLYIEMILAILIICLISPALIALFLQNRVSKLKPDLESIEEKIQAIIHGDYQYCIHLQPNNALAPLAEDLNAISESAAHAKTELVNNLESSLAELQETMETIEIQNIELDIARKKALEANEVKSEFLANASHEFRTPLNGIIGFTQLMLKSDVSESQLEYLRTIESSAQGLLTIINDILDISHIEAGTVKLDYIPTRLDKVIEETLQILAPTAFAAGKELNYWLDTKLPMRVISDPLRIKQILTNLLNSAIEHSSSSGIFLKVSHDTALDNRTMGTDVYGYLFEIAGFENPLNLDTESALRAFSKLDAGSTRSNENGLGLAISKGLINALGGSLGYSNDASKPVLYFSIPLNEGQDESDSPKKALNGISVTLCTENEALSLQLRQIFSDWKINLTEVSKAANIIQTLDKLQSQNRVQQLLIIDIPVDSSKVKRLKKLEQTLYQVNHQFRCKSILVTTPNHQKELSNIQIHNSVVFVNKPLIKDRLYKIMCDHLNINKHSVIKPAADFLKQGRKLKILAVDDNPANLMLVKEFLTNMGVDVSTADTGQDAIDACGSKNFDLIFMDIQMPKIDGITATQKIREKQPSGQRTPIVALTAHAVNDRKSELLLAGLDDYLSKPITQEQLSHVIQRWCQHADLKVQEPLKTGTVTPITDATKRIAKQNVGDDGIIPVEVSKLKSAEKISAQEPLPVTKNLGKKVLEKPVDIDQCIALCNNNTRLAKDMLALLLNSLDDNKSAILKALESEDYDALQEIVHKLRGGTSYTGVHKLKHISTEFDKALVNGETEQVPEFSKSLLFAIDELIDWQEEYDLDVMFEE
ncbi:two-component sensor histidine kinase BarA [Sessilibacter sp. MAH1]